jgi:Flp pilus assembly protein TadB
VKMLALDPLSRKRPPGPLRRAINTMLYSRFTTALIAMLIIAMLSACGSDSPAAEAPGSLTFGLLIAVGVLLIVYVVSMAVARLVTRLMEALATLLGTVVKVAITAGVSGVAIRPGRRGRARSGCE